MGNIFSPMATFLAMAHEKNPMAQIIFPWPKKWGKSGHGPNYSLNALNTKAVKKKLELEQVSRGSCKPPDQRHRLLKANIYHKTLKQMLKNVKNSKPVTLTFGKQQ